MFSRHSILTDCCAPLSRSIAESKEMRLKYLEEQAMFALKTSCENFDNAVFPNAMIAGDCVITHLLGRLGYLESGKCARRLRGGTTA